MKKTVLFGLGFILAVSLFSCKKAEIKTNVVQNENRDVAVTSKEVVKTKLPEKESKQGKIDFDWSKMNYNMLSSLIFDIQIYPEKYQNKRIKASGNFETSVYEGKRYFSVLIWDPTGCCPAGFDFVPPASMKFPEDFPAADEKITVICVFNHFVEDGQDFFVFDAEEIITE